MQEGKDALRQYTIRATVEHVRRETNQQQIQKSPVHYERAKSFPGSTPTAYSRNSHHHYQDESESWELNINAVLCFVAIILILIAYLWFTFRASPNSQTKITEFSQNPQQSNTTAVLPNRVEILELSIFKNLTTSHEKRNFLYSELNNLLSKYNGSTHEIEMSYNHIWTIANHSNLAELSHLYSKFVDRYQDFFKSFNCARSDYNMILDITSQYNDIEKKIQSDKQKIIALLEQEDELAIEKVKIAGEIERLKGLREEQNKHFAAEQEKLKDSQLAVQRHREEIILLECDKILKRIEEYKSKKISLEAELDNFDQKLKHLDQIIEESQSRIYKFEQEVQEKEKLKDVSDLDYRTLLKMRDLVTEVNNFENEKTADLRAKILDTLNILKEKFQLLMKTGQLKESNHSSEKSFYHNAIQILKQHVQLLARMKRVYQNERKLAFEGLEIHGNPDEIEKKQHYYEKELTISKKELDRLREKYESDQQSHTRIQNSYATNKRNLDEISERLNVIAETANECSLKIRQRDKAIEDYETKKNETYSIYKLAVNDLEDELKVRLADERECSVKILSANQAISALQVQISESVNTLAQNYHKFNEERHSFAEKTLKASESYQDVQTFKNKLIDQLNRLDKLDSAN